MYAGGRNIWRITPDTTKVSVEDFKIKDRAPTFKVGGVTITFCHAEGLHFDGDPDDIAVYDADGNALPYTVAVEGNTLIITADGIARVEMGWRNACTHNLYNAAGYLASPFQIFP